MTRTLSVSMVAFDGHPIETALEEIARAGVAHAEPAYISGTMVFDEEDFSDLASAALRGRMAAAGLACRAISAHMDCGGHEASGKLRRRLRFAAGLGARFVITNTTHRSRRDAFLRTVSGVLPVAEQCGVALAFENPGHGADDLLCQGANAQDLLGAIGSPWATLNYDVGNVLTNSEGAVLPSVDLRAALPSAQHLHLKDMRPEGDAWAYTALGDGRIDYVSVLDQLSARPGVSACIELPLMQIRRRGQAPIRATAPPDLPLIRKMIARSVKFLSCGPGTEGSGEN